MGIHIQQGGRGHWTVNYTGTLSSLEKLSTILDTLLNFDLVF